MQQDLNEEKEKEILKPRQQMEEGRKSEEILKKQCLEKEEQLQIEFNICTFPYPYKDHHVRTISENQP